MSWRGEDETTKLLNERPSQSLLIECIRSAHSENWYEWLAQHGALLPNKLHTALRSMAEDYYDRPPTLVDAVVHALRACRYGGCWPLWGHTLPFKKGSGAYRWLSATDEIPYEARRDPAIRQLLTDIVVFFLIDNGYTRLVPREFVPLLPATDLDDDAEASWAYQHDSLAGREELPS